MDTHRPGFYIFFLFVKLEFGGQWPLTMRARCGAFRYCPDPLGIVTAKQLDKLELGGQWPLTMRAWCIAFRYCPNPLGIVIAQQLDKLEFVKLTLYHYVSFVVQTNRAFFLLYYHLD